MMGRTGSGSRPEWVSGREFTAARTVVVASADSELRERLRQTLTELRWQVRVASGGAEAMAQLEASRTEALLLDNWLPDLEVGEFAGQIRLLYPAVDLMHVDGGSEVGGTRSPRRNELLHALRAAKNDCTNACPAKMPDLPLAEGTVDLPLTQERTRRPGVAIGDLKDSDVPLIPEMIGRSEPMRELACLIRLVAPRSATVLIEGETGTGKEVVAKALHRLSARAAKSFTVLNCAAIPESLLEAELFGHTRGAFTGAVQSRTGRIEAAHGGTLFLDEIGEMPLALQAKMLRFLDCGELQRVAAGAERTKGSARAASRPVYANAQMSTQQIRIYCELSSDAERLLERAMQQQGLSARAHDRILKVARTIADIEGAADIVVKHIAEAIQYRTLDRSYWS